MFGFGKPLDIQLPEPDRYIAFGMPLVTRPEFLQPFMERRVAGVLPRRRYVQAPGDLIEDGAWTIQGETRKAGKSVLITSEYINAQLLK